MYHRSFILLCTLLWCLLVSADAQAETLQALAQKSMIILVLADEPSLQKKCHFKPENVSGLSQKLKAAVDQKISNLTEKDFLVLSKRIDTCQIDCSCAIYSLAFEAKNKSNQLLDDKASKETATDRLRCISKIKNICGVIQKI